MQRTGHVRWGNNDRERFLVLVDVGVKTPVLEPTVVNLRCAGGKIESNGYFVGFSVHVRKKLGSD